MKKSVIKIVFALVALVMMGACSQKRVDVEKVVAEMKMPYTMLDGFTINSMSVNDSVIVADCQITDEYVAEMFRNTDFMMVNLNYGTKSNDFKAVRDVVMENNMKVAFVAKDAAGNEVNRVTMTADQMSGELDKGMVTRATAAAENASCPMDMDDGRKLISAVAKGDDTVVYTMECGENYRSTDFVSIEETMKRAMINSMAPDVATKRERNALGIYYKYIYKIGNNTLHTITITPHDWLLY